jgi:hypothetical protein
MARSFFFFFLFGNLCIPYRKIDGDRLLRRFSNAAVEVGLDMLRSSEKVGGALGGSHCRCTGELTERPTAAEYIIAGDSREITRIAAACGWAWPVCSQLRCRRVQLPWNMQARPVSMWSPAFCGRLSRKGKTEKRGVPLCIGVSIIGQLHSPAHNMATQKAGTDPDENAMRPECLRRRKTGFMGIADR